MGRDDRTIGEEKERKGGGEGTGVEKNKKKKNQKEHTNKNKNPETKKNERKREKRGSLVAKNHPSLSVPIFTARHQKIASISGINSALNKKFVFFGYLFSVLIWK